MKKHIFNTVYEWYKDNEKLGTFVELDTTELDIYIKERKSVIYEYLEKDKLLSIKDAEKRFDEIHKDFIRLHIDISNFNIPEYCTPAIIDALIDEITTLFDDNDNIKITHNGWYEEMEIRREKI